jgi:hypothetical protein
MFASFVNSLVQLFVRGGRHDLSLCSSLDNHVLSPFRQLRILGSFPVTISDSTLHTALLKTRFLFSIDHRDHFKIWSCSTGLFEHFNLVLVPMTLLSSSSVGFDARIYGCSNYISPDHSDTIPRDLVEVTVSYLLDGCVAVFEFKVRGQVVHVYGKENFFNYLRVWIQFLDCGGGH